MIRKHAMDILSRREHSKHELFRKLSQKGYEANEIDEVINELVRDNLQSDLRYIEAYVQSRVIRGFGPRYVMRKLRQDGLSEEHIEQFNVQSDIDWYAVMRAAWQKKYDHSPIDVKEASKQARFLLQRGFEPDSVRTLLQELQNGTIT